MSSINIKRFVDVNIVKHEASTVSSIRDTVVLFTAEPETSIDKIFNSYSEYAADNDVKNLTNTKQFAKIYFDNSGNKLRVIKVASNELADAIAGLDNKYIVVAYAAADNYDTVKTVAVAREANADVYGINQKILLARTESLTTLTQAQNFAVKYSNVVGAEMTIAAYLSNINVYGNDSIHDYAFTKENITEETADDTILASVLENNLNVDMYLSNAVRNLGGNLTDGEDLINKFTLIVLHQTLTERILNLLSQKIKGNSAISALYAVISQELSRYVSNGYLTTDKTWIDSTLTTVYNDKTYTIIEEGTALPLGYKVTVLPLNSLSSIDRTERKTPPIYVILADSYGIRKVTISGEVI